MLPRSARTPGGEGGIRTLEWFPITPLAGARLQPLGHLSAGQEHNDFAGGFPTPRRTAPWGSSRKVGRSSRTQESEFRERAGESRPAKGSCRGGEGGIRTHESFHSGGFQDRCLQPLGHLSVEYSRKPPKPSPRYSLEKTEVPKAHWPYAHRVPEIRGAGRGDRWRAGPASAPVRSARPGRKTRRKTRWIPGQRSRPDRSLIFVDPHEDPVARRPGKADTRPRRTDRPSNTTARCSRANRCLHPASPHPEIKPGLLHQISETLKLKAAGG